MIKQTATTATRDITFAPDAMTLTSALWRSRHTTLTTLAALTHRSARSGAFGQRGELSKNMGKLNALRHTTAPTLLSSGEPREEKRV